MAKDRSDVSSWRAIVLTRVDSLQSEVAALPAANQRDNQATVQEIERLLTRANDAALSPSPRVRAWWSGAGIERAWRSIHNAEALLAALQPAETIRVRYPDLLAVARQLLRSDDQRRAAIERWLSERTTGRTEPTAERAQYAASLRWVNSEADNVQARVRSFRNVLIAVTVAMTVVATGLVLVGIFGPDALPVCVEPTTNDASVVAEQQIPERICPTGGAEPHAGDVPLVAFVGLVGAAIASAVAVRRIQGTSTPYSVPLALAVLKLPTGAVTALGGLILIQGEFIPGLSALDNPAQVLAYSIILGYGQELFTRLIDRQGQNLLNSTPGPDPLTPRRNGDETLPPGPAVAQADESILAVLSTDATEVAVRSPETEVAVPSPDTKVGIPSANETEVGDNEHGHSPPVGPSSSAPEP